VSQMELILSYFKKNPQREIKHMEVVDWAVAEHRKLTGEVFRDPDRAIRKLHQDGLLVKVSKGVYKYDPNFAELKKIEDFDEKTKIAIFKRDGFRCLICGRGSESGIEIQADHIKPRDKGGESTVLNGQTLCAQHNFQKKNYDATSFSRNFFENLRKRAKALGDIVTEEFCSEVLDVFDKHGFN
jgi:predicted restriction endonuclease